MRHTIFLFVLWVCYSGAGPRARAEGGSGRSVEEGTVYVPIGKRDPFKRPSVGDGTGRDVQTLNPLEKFTLDQFQLRAILRGTSTASAMFEDPEGRVHIVGEGTIIGRERGTISRILNREVIVTERTINYLGVSSLFERVLSLPAEDEPDPSANAKGGPAPPGGAGGAGAPGAGGGGAAAANPALRGVAQERQQAPRAAAPAAAPPPPAAGGPNVSGGSNLGFYGQKNTAPPPPPPPTSYSGGKK